MGTPVLWHMKVSNYNEKARWALDYKRVPHERRDVEPGRHRRVARRLTGGRTLPVLVLDGRAIGDSTDIVAELERRWPEPPLYPHDADEREQALALEDRFDEQLGPYVRLLAIGSLLNEPDLFISTFLPDLPAARRAVARTVFPVLRRRIRSDFGMDERSFEEAYAKIAAVGDVVPDDGYLVGDAFTVADLTLAALVSPAVAPEQFPYPQPQRDHPVLARLRAALDEAGLGAFCRRMYAQHRGTSAAVAA